MGLSRYIYLGPYLHCQAQLVDDFESIYSCHKEGCQDANARHYDRRSPRFCEHCGTLFTLQDIPVKRKRARSVDATQEIKEALSDAFSNCGGTDGDGSIACWLPNKNRNQPREFEIENDTDIDLGGHAQGGSLDALSEHHWFVEAFKPEIDTLTTLYGAENVEVKWGLIAYTM